MINSSRILLLTLLTIDAYIFFSGTKEDYDRLIVFSHISPFIHNSNEPSGYFNLKKEIRLQLLQALNNAKCTHWFCGTCPILPLQLNSAIPFYDTDI